MNYTPSSHSIDVIRDPDTPIPKDLLHPHYDDPRFTERNLGRVVFLAPGVLLDRNGYVEDAVYMESDGYGLWSRFSDFASRQEAAELVPGSANYFEAVLNEMLPGLHQNTQVIHKFGRNVSGLKLLAITSGIKGHDLYSFNEFAVVPQTSEE